MDVENLLQHAIVVALVIVPALGFTARFALKPIVDALLRLKEGGLIASSSTDAVGQELRLLRDEVRLLREETAEMQQRLTRLDEAQSFHRALVEPAGPGALPPAAAERQVAEPGRV